MRTDAATLERLSFGRVQAALAERAATYLGREKAAAVVPLADAAALTERLDQVQELIDGGLLRFGGVVDVRNLLQRVRDGSVLDGTEILQVAYTLDAAATMKRAILASERKALSDLALGIGSFDGALRQVREQLDNDGNVRDDATPKLQDIRRRLNPLRGRIRERLQRLMETHSDDVQEPIITLRRDRYVIPVKAYAQSRVPGLVLDRSDSGATVFIEPAGVVDLNNELALLLLEEQDEVRRILYALGRRLADEPLVDDSIERLADLDVVNSAARLAQEWRLVRPQFDDDGRVRLVKARHPLIEGCVPNDIELDADRRMLIITGPNAGGKTVLLKTLGLATAMAYSGLFVAAEERPVPLLPRLDSLLADIGDQQSIEANLSTYAGHLRNLERIVDEAGPRTLVLIDELGSGTDPEEGAAISQAILERVLERGSRGLVTTHLAPLKAFAGNVDGAKNAAMRFDLEKLGPSYQLVVGEPGRSYALAIAQRMGLDAELLDRANALLGEEAGRLERLLATLEDQRQELELELELSKEASATAAAEAELLREQIDRLRARESELMSAAAQKADAMLQETLQRATKLRRAATHQPEQRSKALEELQQLRREARHVSGNQSRVVPGAAAVAAPVDPLRQGAKVRVKSYAATGTIEELRDDSLVVRIGLVKMTVPRSDVEPLRGATPMPSTTLERAAGGKRRSASARVDIPTPTPAGFQTELNIRGERVEEALEKVRDFVLEAAALKVASVRLMHGKGTGALRDAVRNYLRNDRLVERFEDAVPYEGGHGVTVAYLRV